MVGDVILGINNISINKEGSKDPFQQYVDAWESLKDENIITLYMRDGSISVSYTHLTLPTKA